MDPMSVLVSMYNDQAAKRPDAVAWPDRRRHRDGSLARRIVRAVRGRRPVRTARPAPCPPLGRALDGR